MEPSRWKKLWDAIKPPPASPCARQPEMRQDSAWSRFWEALMPPGLSPEGRRRLPRIVGLTAAVLLIGGAAAWGVHRRIASAQERAATALQEGMKLSAAGNYAAAVDRLSGAVGTDARTAYFQRGLAHRNLHQLDLAQADFEKAIQLAPNVGAVHTALGSVLRQRGEAQRAVEEFTAAIALDQDVNAYYQRGLMYESLGEHRKAIDDYNVAIRATSDAPYGYLARALARENSGDHAGAEADRKKGAELENR